MKESVAIAKEANTKKEYLPTRSGNSIHRVRNEPERQISSLRRVIGNIRRDGSTPSVDSIATELSSMSVAQRASVLLALQRTHGNWYVQRVVAGVQTKLKVGQPGDIYEQEADRVADEVMRMPEPRVRHPENDKRNLTKPISEQIIPQAKPNSHHSTGVDSGLGLRINCLGGGGQPLPQDTRSYFECRFGRDFSEVRIHQGSEATHLARLMNAEAFTIGRDIVLGSGHYSLHTNAGKRLLAHELTHVIQQNNMNGIVQRYGLCRGYQPDETSRSWDYGGIIDNDVRLRQSREPAGVQRRPATETMEWGEAPYPMELIVADYPIGSEYPSIEAQTDPLLLEWIERFENDESYIVEIIGYSDCVGDRLQNRELRSRRADRMTEIMGAVAASRVVSRGNAPLFDFLTGNNTPEQRALNRAVAIRFYQEHRFPTERITGTPHRGERREEE